MHGPTRERRILSPTALVRDPGFPIALAPVLVSDLSDNTTSGMFGLHFEASATERELPALLLALHDTFKLLFHLATFWWMLPARSPLRRQCSGAVPPLSKGERP